MTPAEEFIELEDNGRKKKVFVYAWDDGKLNLPQKGKIDYASFFLQCPEYSSPVKEDTFYYIDWEQTINVDSGDCNILSIFLIARYVSLISSIIRSGLKKDYVSREENLNSKVRGRILQKQNTQKNIVPGHLERFYCSFQEYTEDIPVNRFHKAILLECRQIIQEQSRSVIVTTGNPLYSTINRCLSSMQHVGVVGNLRSYMRSLQSPHGKLFRNYEKGLELARMILKLQAGKFYQEEGGKIFSLPKFWIYLPTMFEHYVYGHLNLNYDISPQPEGFLRRRADFIVHSSPQMVIDVKYKDWYKTDVGKLGKDYIEALLKDCRQIACYARDESFFTNEADVLCVFVYPVFEKRVRKNAPQFDIFENGQFGDVEQIKGLRDYYKVGIAMPTIKG